MAARKARPASDARSKRPGTRSAMRSSRRFPMATSTTAANSLSLIEPAASPTNSNSAAIDCDGVTVSGSTGQPRVNSAIA